MSCFSSLIQLGSDGERFMMRRIIVKLFFICWFLCLFFQAHAQSSCNCPVAASCKPCKNEITSITIKYAGLVGAFVSVRDKGNIIVTKFLNPGDVLTVSGQKSNNKFDDKQVDILVNFVPLTTIDVTCSLKLDPTKLLGLIYLIGAESRDNGPICCTPTVGDGKPVISGCPSDITTSLPSSSCTKTVTWPEPVASDCNLKSFESNIKPGETFSAGTTTVTYTAKDDNNNITTCSFNVTVEDKIAPVVSKCPVDISLNADANCKAKASWTAPTFTDNCASLTITSTNSSGDLFPVGTTTVTYTAKDKAGNTTLCKFKVVVKDNTAPTVTNCPTSLTVNAGTDCKAKATWTAPTFTDNCSTVTVTSTYASGSVFPLGTTAVTYTGKDSFGNTATCKFNVIIVDNTAPIVSNCPADITIVTEQTCEAKATWSMPIFTDNCSAVSISASHRPGDVFAVGTTTVTYSAKDKGNNTTVCTFNVIIKDKDAPVIKNCPSDVAVLVLPGGSSVVNWDAPTASDECSLESFESSNTSGQSFPVGDTRVMYTAKDKSGHTSTCEFTVSVKVEDISLDISKIITPDVSTTDSKWIIGNIDKYDENKVVIVDRWGSLIYQVSDYDNDRIVWDGHQSNGNALPTGTYFYIVSVKSGTTWIEKKGFIELVR